MALSPARSVSARPALSFTVLARVRGLATAGTWADLLVVGTLVALAGWVRWPHLLLSPQFPSVSDTVMLALDVAQARAFHLADSAPYLGAPFLWLLALVYAVFGPSVEATQLLAWALGTLTIVPTYLLAREAGGRVAGLVAAAFLATSGAHTVITSHVALSHSLTPFVSTIALWLVARAARVAGAPDGGLARGGRLLAFGGLLSGLALQTHPTVAPLLVGAALGAVLMRPAWLRTRWPMLAVALVVVGYSSLLYYHVSTRFAIVADVESKQERYLDADEDAGESASRGVYLNNLTQLGLSSVRLVGGALEDRERPSAYLADPWLAGTAAMVLAGLALAAWRRSWWLIGGVLLAILLPPALSGKYRPILDGRYLMPLVPVLFVALGLAVAQGARVLTAYRQTEVLGVQVARGVALLVLVGGVAMLAAHPLALLDTFYEESQEDGFSNALYYRTLQQVEAARIGDEAVLLDPQLATVKSAGGGKASSSFLFLLALADVPTADLTGRLAILHRSTADRLDDSLELTPLDGKRANGKDSPSYRAYRIGDAATASAPPRSGRR
jgi:hypothetical protein